MKITVDYEEIDKLHKEIARLKEELAGSLRERHLKAELQKIALIAAGYFNNPNPKNIEYEAAYDLVLGLWYNYSQLKTEIYPLQKLESKCISLISDVDDREYEFDNPAECIETIVANLVERIEELNKK